MDELLKEWAAALKELGFEPGTEAWDAACVLLAPIYVGMDRERISAYTSLAPEVVAACAERLSLSGIWDEREGTFRAEWDHAEWGHVAFVLDAGVAEGIYERVEEGYRFLPPTRRHGAFNRYESMGCRCSLCRAANAERHREQRHARRARVAPAELHGKATTYSNWMCRCDACSAAWSVQMREEKERRARASGKHYEPRDERPTLVGQIDALLRDRAEATIRFPDHRYKTVRNAVALIGKRQDRAFSVETISVRDGKRKIRVRDRALTTS